MLQIDCLDSGDAIKALINKHTPSPLDKPISMIKFDADNPRKLNNTARDQLTTNTNNIFDMINSNTAGITNKTMELARLIALQNEFKNLTNKKVWANAVVLALPKAIDPILKGNDPEIPALLTHLTTFLEYAENDKELDGKPSLLSDNATALKNEIARMMGEGS